MLNKVGTQNLIIPQRNNSKTSKQSFKGGAEVLRYLEKKPILALVGIDALGMVIPRIAIDTLRNKKELGHLNYSAGRETTFRETSCMYLLYFLPATVAAGVGRFFANSHFADKGVDTKQIIGSSFLNAAKDKLGKSKGNNAKDLKFNFVEKMLDSMKLYGKETKFDLGKEKNNIINEILAIKGSSENADKAIQDVACKITSGKESRFKMSYPSEVKAGKQAQLKGTVNNLITDMVKFKDGFIDKNIDKALDKTKQFKPNKLFDEVSTLVKETIKLNHIKSKTSFGIALASLVAFPAINIWITKKLSPDNSGDFPGKQGLEGKSNLFDRLKYLKEVKNADKK